jgi:signal transduction histidine kinase
MENTNMETRDQVLEDIAALVSHQIIGCASRIQALTEIWADGYFLSEQIPPEVLHILRSEVKKLRRMGQDALYLNLAVTQEIPLSFRSLNLIDLIEEMLPSFQAQAFDRAFENYYAPGLPLIWGDPERIQDVLDNLIGNALKYSAPQSPIIISVHRHNDQAQVSVANFGSYIQPADRERVFTKFYRGKGHHQAGYGLGLYLSRRLVELHGGQIWVESSPSGMTTFNFTLLLANQIQAILPFSGKKDALDLSLRDNSPSLRM